MDQRTDRICRWNRHFVASSSSTHLLMCTRRAKFGGYPVRGVVMILGQMIQRFSEDRLVSRGARKSLVVGLITRFLGRKTFSHRRSNFPSTHGFFGLGVHQWLGELEAEQVIAVQVGDPQGACPQDSEGFG